MSAVNKISIIVAWGAVYPWLFIFFIFIRIEGLSTICMAKTTKSTSGFLFYSVGVRILFTKTFVIKIISKWVV